MQDFAVQQAAKDTNYLPPRYRTLPTLASITPIANYPSKLRIFKTNASRYWQVRYYLKGKTYTQSLKTTNKLAAISLPGSPCSQEQRTITDSIADVC